MKKSKRIVCVLLSFVLCLSMTSPAMAATAKYTKASNAYKARIKKLENNPMTPTTYDIVDIDGNGVPEFLVSGPWDNYVYTYNVSKNKIVLLKKLSLGKAYGNGVTYSKTKKMFTVFTANTGGYTKIFYKVNGSKATKYATYEYINNRHSSTGKAQYLIKGKKYSKSSYTKKLKNLEKKFKNLRYKKS